MGDFLSWAVWLAGFITAVIGALYIVTAIVSVEAFVGIFWRGRRRRESQGLKEFLELAWYFLLAVSIGRFLHGGFAYVVAIIPAGWGGLNDDGDWQSFRNDIHWMLDCYATISVLVRAESAALLHLEQEARDKALADHAAAAKPR